MPMPDETWSEDEELLVELVRRALDARQRGEDVDLRVLCGARADLAEAVAEALGLGRDLDALGGLPAPEPAGARRVLAGRYRLDAPLGRGAMGVVWEATDLELGRAVAVKLFETLGVPKAEDVGRFDREATLLASLQHPFVVTIHDRGRDADGTLFVVMERLFGAPLSDLLQRAAEAEGDGGLTRMLDLAVGGLGGVPPESTWLRRAPTWPRRAPAKAGRRRRSLRWTKSSTWRSARWRTCRMPRTRCCSWTSTRTRSPRRSRWRRGRR